MSALSTNAGANRRIDPTTRPSLNTTQSIIVNWRSCGRNSKKTLIPELQVVELAQEEAYLASLLHCLKERILETVNEVVPATTKQALGDHNLFGIVGCTLEGKDFTNIVHLHAKRAVTSKFKNNRTTFDPQTHVL